MAEIHGNPAVMREYARYLLQFGEDATQRVSLLRQRLQQIGATEWTDDNFKQFFAEFEVTEQELVRVLARVEGELVPYLSAMAARYEALE